MNQLGMFRELTVANAKEMVRDKMSMFWFLAFPLIFVFLYGAIFTFDSSSITFNISTVAEIKSPISLLLNKTIKSVPAFNLHTGNLRSEMDALRRGERNAVIVVPKDAKSNWEAGRPVTLPVYFDNSSSNTGSVVLSSVNQLLGGVESQLTGMLPRLVMESRPIRPKKMKQIDYLLPGILGMAIMQTGLFGAIRVVGLREQKILKGLGATPLPRWLFIASEVSIRMCLSLVQTALIVGVGVGVFKVHITGNPMAVLGTVMLGSLAFISLGYLLASFIKTVDGGQGLVQAVQFPMLFLSGIFIPTELMPKFMGPVVKAMPLTYLGNALRQVMVGINGDTAYAVNAAVLVVWTVVCVALASRLWRWE